MLKISFILIVMLSLALIFCNGISVQKRKYTFTTFAGEIYGHIDGHGKLAKLKSPEGIAADKNGNLYVTEYGSSVVRKITPEGMVSTLAGKDMETGSADGPLSVARFNHPHGIAVDDNLNVYVSDMKNCTIRKISPEGIVETIAGSPEIKGSADGKGHLARFNQPEGIAVNSKGIIYVADTYNYTIREISTNGKVKTFAGKAGVAGNSDGKGFEATFNMPIGIAIDGQDNIFVVDSDYDGENPGNCTVRKINPDGEVTTLAGLAGHAGATDGSRKDARFDKPVGITATTDGTLFIADTGAKTIRKINSKGKVSTIGGLYRVDGNQDGIGEAARFYDPQSIAVDKNGVLYIADTFNNRIVKGENTY